jgi:hypothetical protein
MTNSKTYLNVPYAQKDTVKSLGARWDTANKKWYVPDNIDVTLFAKWQADQEILESPSRVVVEPKVLISSTTSSIKAIKSSSVPVFTNPVDKNFVAYNEDEPPWE